MRTLSLALLFSCWCVVSSLGSTFVAGVGLPSTLRRVLSAPSALGAHHHQYIGRRPGKVDVVSSPSLALYTSSVRDNDANELSETFKSNPGLSQADPSFDRIDEEDENEEDETLTPRQVNERTGLAFRISRFFNQYQNAEAIELKVHRSFVQISGDWGIGVPFIKISASIDNAQQREDLDLVEVSPVSPSNFSMNDDMPISVMRFMHWPSIHRSDSDLDAEEEEELDPQSALPIHYQQTLGDLNCLEIWDNNDHVSGKSRSMRTCLFATQDTYIHVFTYRGIEYAWWLDHSGTHFELHRGPGATRYRGKLIARYMLDSEKISSQAQAPLILIANPGSDDFWATLKSVPALEYLYINRVHMPTYAQVVEDPRSNSAFLYDGSIHLSSILAREDGSFLIQSGGLSGRESVAILEEVFGAHEGKYFKLNIMGSGQNGASTSTGSVFIYDDKSHAIVRLGQLSQSTTDFYLWSKETTGSFTCVHSKFPNRNIARLENQNSRLRISLSPGPKNRRLLSFLFISVLQLTRDD